MAHGVFGKAFEPSRNRAEYLTRGHVGPNLQPSASNESLLRGEVDTLTTRPPNVLQNSPDVRLHRNIHYEQ